ncbi:hypothetical protein PISMIDRAFT_107324 [Pisolithus microcarpus 441]|uniref:DUF6699 domain-containing protein n=1 Tax=Pisolithus microcarpus 441 TaxID=765257 RepID=A0A0C9ZHV0_9AGAM|nr:hypothetical protein PISMIDRAFT_107324 [Pisolithus microcarpus 441]
MLYDTPDGGPFIPPLPSPEGAIPPPVPPTNHQETAPSGWVHQPRTPSHYPYYPPGLPNITPFIPSAPSLHNTPVMPPPAEAPGSYYPPPVTLPNVYGPLGGPPAGVPADMTGYPNVAATAWVPPAAVPPPPQAWPPQHPPPSAYATFQQPLPNGPPGWGLPAAYHTPATAAWGMQMLPPTMTPYAYPAATPWMGPANAPPPPPPPPPPPCAPATDTARANIRWTTRVDHMDPFAEGPHYGPVLEPFLARVVGAIIKINPLLAPPGDSLDDYLRWNMLFHTSNCYRTTDSRRSWMKGRKAPATYPRLTYIRIVSRSFPWMIQIVARDKAIGVTCGEILDGISGYMYGDVAKKEYENVSRSLKRQIFTAYQHNRSTDPNVPGGRLGEALKRLDWLGRDTQFGGLVVNDEFIKEHCGDVLPATFELKCLPSYPLTQRELHEQQLRQQAARSRNGSQSRSPAHSGSGRSSRLSEERD